jgi:hypothetical protein
MSSTALSVNATTGDLSLGGKSIATKEYIDEKIDSIDITNPPYTAPIIQTLRTANGTDKANIVLGNGALTTYLSNDTGEHNTAIGNETLKNTTNSYNTAVGYAALYANTSGWKNTALGHETLVRNTTGRFNTGLGKNAFWGNTTQNNNTAVGHNAAFEGAAGDNNTIVGASSCENKKIGSHNSTLGTNALYNGCGDLNTAIGYNAGRNSKQYNDNLGLTNNRNTFLGSLSNLIDNTNTFSSSTAVGYNSKITASNQIVLGTSTETVNIPKFTSAGIVKNDASGNLSSSGSLSTADIGDATITGAKLDSSIALPSAATATTQVSTNNSTSVATTAFVKNQNYAPLASPTFTGTVTGITSAMVGLGNVTNTSDADKVVSTATQSALDLKAPLASPEFTGEAKAPTPASTSNDTTIATTAFVTTAVTNLVNGAPGALDTLKELSDALGSDANYATTITNALAAKAPLESPAFTGTVTGITSEMVGLGNVNNTSDADKPISNTQQIALNKKAPLVDPVFDGTPRAPTPASSSNDTSIATTAFVKSQTSSIVSNIIPVSTTPPNWPLDGQFYFSPPSVEQGNNAWLRVAHKVPGQSQKWYSFIVGDVRDVTNV